MVEPGDTVWYLLSNGGGYLQFYKAPEGKAVGAAVSLAILDDLFGLPVTQFYPPGWSIDKQQYVNSRKWYELESHEEIWGSVRLSITRNVDGWTVPASPEYISRDGNPNTSAQSDWAIFMVRIDSL